MQEPVPVGKLPAALRAEVRRLAGLNARPPLGHRPWVLRPMRDLVGGALLAFACLAFGLPWLATVFESAWEESGGGGGAWYERLAGFGLLAGIGLAVFSFTLVAGVRRLRRGSGGIGARSKPTPAADIRRCGWCGVESLVLPSAPSASGGDAAWSLADRIREGAPNLMQVEAETYGFVLAMQKATLYSAIFLFVPNGLVYVVFERIWRMLLG